MLVSKLSTDDSRDCMRLKQYCSCVSRAYKGRRHGPVSDGAWFVTNYSNTDNATIFSLARLNFVIQAVVALLFYVLFLLYKPLLCTLSINPDLFFVSLSVWFNSARVGLVVGFVAWFVNYFPFLFIPQNYTRLTL